METKFKPFVAVDFFQKLQEDSLSTPVYLTGMVKKTGDNEKAIQFAIGKHCSDWITIPLDMIENVELLKKVSCKDHSHPYVRLYLKAQKTGEAKTLLLLLYAAITNTYSNIASIRSAQCRAGGGHVMKMCNVDEDGNVDWNSCRDACAGGEYSGQDVDDTI